PQHLHYVVRRLEPVQPPTHDEATVVVHEADHVDAVLRLEHERHDIRLPEVVRIGALEGFYDRRTIAAPKTARLRLGPLPAHDLTNRLTRQLQKALAINFTLDPRDARLRVFCRCLCHGLVGGGHLGADIFEAPALLTIQPREPFFLVLAGPIY